MVSGFELLIAIFVCSALWDAAMTSIFTSSEVESAVDGTSGMESSVCCVMLLVDEIGVRLSSEVEVEVAIEVAGIFNGIGLGRGLKARIELY